MSGVAVDVIRKFQNKNLIRTHLAAFLGFLGGAKTCDLLFFDQGQYDQLREDMEDEYWAKFGEPKEIKPYQVNSQRPGREHEIRKSWIYIMYDKDKLIKKKDEMD